MRILRSQYLKQQQKCTDAVTNINNKRKTPDTHQSHNESTAGTSARSAREHKFHIPAGQSVLAVDLPEQQHRITVNIVNTTNEDTPPIDVVVKFYDPDAHWFTRFYHQYQSLLWTRYPREPRVKHKRWYFKCGICMRTVCSFYELKSHLNLHLGFYPNACTDCPKRFTNRATLRRHCRFKHIFQQ